MICPICLRDCPDRLMEKHHLRTRKADRKLIELICQGCHKTIHGLFTNRELANESKELDSVDGLMANESFYKAVRFIRKQPPEAKIKMKQANRKRGRN